MLSHCHKTTEKTYPYADQQTDRNEHLKYLCRPEKIQPPCNHLKPGFNVLYDRMITKKQDHERDQRTDHSDDDALHDERRPYKKVRSPHQPHDLDLTPAHRNTSGDRRVDEKYRYGQEDRDDRDGHVADEQIGVLEVFRRLIGTLHRPDPLDPVYVFRDLLLIRNIL